MKSWMKAAAAGAAVALLAACGTDRAAEPVMPQESAAKTEAANAEGKEGKVLIAYFTWAENTQRQRRPVCFLRGIRQKWRAGYRNGPAAICLPSG